MSVKIGMYYSVTPTPIYQQLSKPVNKEPHPYIMKVMNSKASQVISSEFKTFAAMNSEAFALKHKKDPFVKEDMINQNPQALISQQQLNKNVLFSVPQQPASTNKFFSMNWSELSTGKPCGVCGGR